MTDPTAAERIADLYFAGLRMMGFIFEPTAERQAERMLADHVQTALAEAKREVWEEVVKYHRTQCRYQGCRESRQGFDCDEIKEYCRRSRAT